MLKPPAVLYCYLFGCSGTAERVAFLCDQVASACDRAPPGYCARWGEEAQYPGEVGADTVAPPGSTAETTIWQGRSASIGFREFGGNWPAPRNSSESCPPRDRAKWRCLHPRASAAPDRFPADNSSRRDGSSPGIPPRHHFAWATGRIARPSQQERRCRRDAAAARERRIPARGGKRRWSPSSRSSLTRHAGGGRRQ